jgi:hypothetical protein
MQYLLSPALSPWRIDLRTYSKGAIHREEDTFHQLIPSGTLGFRIRMAGQMRRCCKLFKAAPLSRGAAPLWGRGKRGRIPAPQVGGASSRRTDCPDRGDKACRRSEFPSDADRVNASASFPDRHGHPGHRRMRPQRRSLSISRPDTHAPFLLDEDVQ